MSALLQLKARLLQVKVRRGQPPGRQTGGDSEHHVKAGENHPRAEALPSAIRHAEIRDQPARTRRRAPLHRRNDPLQLIWPETVQKEMTGDGVVCGTRPSVGIFACLRMGMSVQRSAGVPPAASRNSRYCRAAFRHQHVRVNESHMILGEIALPEGGSRQFQHPRAGVEAGDARLRIDAQQFDQKPSPPFAQQKNIPGIDQSVDKCGATALEQRAGSDPFQPSIVRRNGVEAHAGMSRLPESGAIPPRPGRHAADPVTRHIQRIARRVSQQMRSPPLKEERPDEQMPAHFEELSAVRRRASPAGGAARAARAGRRG